LLYEPIPGFHAPDLLRADTQHSSKPPTSFYRYSTYEVYQVLRISQQTHIGAVSPGYLHGTFDFVVVDLL
jgi:hypothetical protein